MPNRGTRGAWATAGAAALLLLSGCARPVSPQERALFVTGQDLRRVHCDTGRPGRGHFSKQRVPFIYDSIDYKLNATGEGVSCKVVIAATVIAARDARTAMGVYGGGVGGAQIGLDTHHIKLVEAKGQFHYGDQSQYFDLTKKGRVVGFYFQARLGRVVYQYLVFGLRFTTPDSFATLFEPKLKLTRERYADRT